MYTALSHVWQQTRRSRKGVVNIACAEKARDAKASRLDARQYRVDMVKLSLLKPSLQGATLPTSGRCYQRWIWRSDEGKPVFPRRTNLASLPSTGGMKETKGDLSLPNRRSRVTVGSPKQGNTCMVTEVSYYSRLARNGFSSLPRGRTDKGYKRPVREVKATCPGGRTPVVCTNQEPIVG